MSDRKKSLQSLRKKIGISIPLSEQMPLEIVPTGVLTLDMALGVGGWARGTMNMVWGGFSSGKTALLNTTVAELHRTDPDAMACYIDIEGTIRKEWLEKFGVDTERTELVQVSTTEEMVDALQDILRSGIFDVIVIDSIGAISRAIEVDGKDGKGGDSSTAVYAGSAALVSRMVRVGNSELTRIKRDKQNNPDIIVPTVLFVNQQRVDFSSQYAGVSFPGGKALGHMLTTVVYVTARNGKDDVLMGTIRDGVQAKVGQLTQARVEKNKLAPPSRIASYYFTFQECPEHPFGIDQNRALVDVALEIGALSLSGSWATLYDFETGEELHKCQGKASMAKWIGENPDVRDSLSKKALESFGNEKVTG